MAEMIKIRLAKIVAAILTVSCILLTKNVAGEETLEFKISLAKPMYSQGEEITVTTKLVNHSNVEFKVIKPPLTAFTRVLTFKITERHTGKLIQPQVKWDGPGSEGVEALIPAGGEIASSCDIIKALYPLGLEPGKYWIQGYYKTDKHSLSSNKVFFSVKALTGNEKEAFQMYKCALQGAGGEVAISRCLKMLVLCNGWITGCRFLNFTGMSAALNCNGKDKKGAGYSSVTHIGKKADHFAYYLLRSTRNIPQWHFCLQISFSFGG